MSYILTRCATIRDRADLGITEGCSKLAFLNNWGDNFATTDSATSVNNKAVLNMNEKNKH